MSTDEELTETVKKVSMEDRRTFKPMKDAAKMVEGHHELPLSGREDSQTLPESLRMERKRLENLNNKLLQDGGLKGSM